MSEHISAVEAQALLDAATPGPWEEWANCEGHGRDVVHEDPPGIFFVIAQKMKDDGNVELVLAAPRLAAEVVRLRRELDARTDVMLAARLRLMIEWAHARGEAAEDLAEAARLLGGGE